MASKKDVYQDVTDKIIAKLEEGTVPWHQPWQALGGIPLSLSTHRPYRGINTFLLGVEALDKGYTSPWWGTYGQIAKLAGMVKVDTPRGPRWRSPDDTPRGVRAGQHSTEVILWKRYSKRVQDETSGEWENRTFFLLRTFYVFNAEQADGLPAKYFPQATERAEFEVIDEAQRVADDYLTRTGISLHHGGSGANYQPGRNIITVPERETFDSAFDYYDTLFHEEGHSTGDKGRLNRPGVAEFDHFGSNKYGKEELVAELAGAMVNATVGVSVKHVDENSAAYIASWLKTIKGDVKLVIQAAAQAQKAADLILGVTFEDTTDE